MSTRAAQGPAEWRGDNDNGVLKNATITLTFGPDRIMLVTGVTGEIHKTFYISGSCQRATVTTQHGIITTTEDSLRFGVKYYPLDMLFSEFNHRRTFSIDELWDMQRKREAAFAKVPIIPQYNSDNAWKKFTQAVQTLQYSTVPREFQAPAQFDPWNPVLENGLSPPNPKIAPPPQVDPWNAILENAFNPPKAEPPKPKIEPPPLLKGEDEFTEIETEECAVCQENARKVLIQPCNHYLLCFGCYGKIMDVNHVASKKCPKCRTGITNAIRPY